MPAHGQAEAKAELRAIFDSIDAQPGPNAGAEASRRAEAFAAKWRKLSPAAVDCLEYDFEHLVTFLLIEGGWSRVA